MLSARGRATAGALDLELDLRAESGQTVGLVGPNGAGKTATLSVLLGLVTLREGRITLDGRTLDDGTTRLAPHARGLAWCPQVPALLPRRPPAAQVRAFAHPGAPLLRDRTVDRLLEDLGLEPDDRRPPTRLSGGQAQRVAVARALAASRTVLLDEPTSAQDADGAARVRRAVQTHVAAGGTAVVVSHRPEDAYATADRLLVLDGGRVVQAGRPEELATRPATPYIGQVVGATVLDGTVSAGTLHGEWGRLTVADGTPEGPATAVILPTAVALHRGRPAGSARNSLHGTVGEVIRSPEGVRVRTVTAPPLVAALTNHAADELDLDVGGEVWATVKATEVQVIPS